MRALIQAHADAMRVGFSYLRWGRFVTTLPPAAISCLGAWATGEMPLVGTAVVFLVLLIAAAVFDLRGQAFVGDDGRWRLGRLLVAGKVQEGASWAWVVTLRVDLRCLQAAFGRWRPSSKMRGVRFRRWSLCYRFVPR